MEASYCFINKNKKRRSRIFTSFRAPQESFSMILPHPVNTVNSQACTKLNQKLWRYFCNKEFFLVLSQCPYRLGCLGCTNPQFTLGLLFLVAIFNWESSSATHCWLIDKLTMLMCACAYITNYKSVRIVHVWITSSFEVSFFCE